MIHSAGNSVGNGNNRVDCGGADDDGDDVDDANKRRQAVEQVDLVDRVYKTKNQITTNLSKWRKKSLVQVVRRWKHLRQRTEKPPVFPTMASNESSCNNGGCVLATIGDGFLRVFHAIVALVVRGLMKIIYGGKGETMPAIKDLTLLDSATTLARKIRTKKLKSVDVLESFIARIEEINPTFNCLVAKRYELAREEARKADELIESGLMSEEQLAKEKPFLGVPFTTKDGIQAKGMPYTAGLYKRKGTLGAQDSDAVGCMRKAGAILIGLTNIPELCMWWETSNTLYGRTNNPYDSNRMVGGSSGGEGAIQAGAGVAFGLGSDIGGSIRMPAYFTGIFGHKPSPLAVSNNGQWPEPLSEEQDKFLGIGPMCRRAEDLAPILKVISDKKAPLLRLDEPVNVKNIRYFYQLSNTGSGFMSPISPDIKQVIQEAVKYLEKTHNISATETNFTEFRKSNDLWFANMKCKDGPDFTEQMGNMKYSVNIGLEFLKWLVGRSEHTFIVIATAFVEKIGIQYGSKEYHELVEVRDKFRQQLIDLLGDDGVLLYPVHPTCAQYHNEPIYKPFNFAYTGVINVLKLPATSCPLGLGAEGLPIGLQVIAAPNQDRLCLAVAQELEKAFGGWVPPPVLA